MLEAYSKAGTYSRAGGSFDGGGLFEVITENDFVLHGKGVTQNHP